LSQERTPRRLHPRPRTERTPQPGFRLHKGHALSLLALLLSFSAAAAQVNYAPVASPGFSPPQAAVAQGDQGETPDVEPGLCARRDPKSGIYHPARLTVINPCQTVTGTVAALRPEGDGDYHIRVTLDPPYAHLINQTNIDKQHGDLVVEIPCVNPVTQADAQATCSRIEPRLKLQAPKVGQHISVTGPYVNDGEHGWNEIHPIYEWHEVK